MRIASGNCSEVLNISRFASFDTCRIVHRGVSVDKMFLELCATRKQDANNTDPNPILYSARSFNSHRNIGPALFATPSTRFNTQELYSSNAYYINADNGFHETSAFQTKITRGLKMFQAVFP